MNILTENIKQVLENALSHEVQYFLIGKPVSVSKITLDKGMIIVQPKSTGVVSAATGLRDMETNTVDIILAKSVQDEFIKNNQKESGMQYLMRVMDNRSPDGSLKTDSVRYIIRNQLRNLGIAQPSISIEYDTNELDKVAEGIVTATLTITQEDLISQPLA